MDEQMIEKMAKALHDAFGPFADYSYPWEDPLASKDMFRQLARAAHSVMSARVAEMEEALDMLCDSVEREDELNGSISGALMADVREARAALAPHPKGTDQL